MRISPMRNLGKGEYTYARTEKLEYDAEVGLYSLSFGHPTDETAVLAFTEEELKDLVQFAKLRRNE